MTGLLTGCDIIEQLTGTPIGSKVFLPRNVLRAGENYLLDDVTIDQIAEKLGTEVKILGPSGRDFIFGILGRVV